jgi:hypothetical protein
MAEGSGRSVGNGRRPGGNAVGTTVKHCRHTQAPPRRRLSRHPSSPRPIVFRDECRRNSMQAGSTPAGSGFHHRPRRSAVEQWFRHPWSSRLPHAANACGSPLVRAPAARQEVAVRLRSGPRGPAAQETLSRTLVAVPVQPLERTTDRSECRPGFHRAAAQAVRFKSSPAPRPAAAREIPPSLVAAPERMANADGTPWILNPLVAGSTPAGSSPSRDGPVAQSVEQAPARASVRSGKRFIILVAMRPSGHRSWHAK